MRTEKLRKGKYWKLAEVVSRVFDPVWEVPIAILIAMAFALQEGLRWRFLGLLLFIDGVMPGIFFLLMIWHKQVDSWDIRDRKKRLPIYFFTLLCHMGGAWLAYELGKIELALTLVVFYSIAIVFIGITVFWKISLHAGVNAVLITMLNVFTGWVYWPLYAILGLVVWARHYQAHHSWGQLWAGAMLGGGMVYFGLRAVGF